MLYVETPAELAEWLADTFGQYSCPRSCRATHDELRGHPEACWCRQCFVLEVTHRIRAAVANEHGLMNVPRSTEQRVRLESPDCPVKPGGLSVQESMTSPEILEG